MTTKQDNKITFDQISEKCIVVLYGGFTVAELQNRFGNEWGFMQNPAVYMDNAIIQAVAIKLAELNTSINKIAHLKQFVIYQVEGDSEHYYRCCEKKRFDGIHFQGNKLVFNMLVYVDPSMDICPKTDEDIAAALKNWWIADSKAKPHIVLPPKWVIDDPMKE